MNQLIGVCGDDCDITSDIIDMPSFDCDPDSTTTVIYLARLSGTSERDSDYLISVIQDWVNNGASIIVASILMTVDTKCMIFIPSLNERECIPLIEIPSETPTTEPNTDPTTEPSPKPTPEPSPKPTPEPTPEPTPGLNTDPSDDPMTDSTSSSASDNTTAIIGGVVVVVVFLIIAITVTVIAIVAMVLKGRRHGNVSMKNAPEK